MHVAYKSKELSGSCESHSLGIAESLLSLLNKLNIYDVIVSLSIEWKVVIDDSIDRSEILRDALELTSAAITSFVSLRTRAVISHSDAILSDLSGASFKELSSLSNPSALIIKTVTALLSLLERRKAKLDWKLVKERLKRISPTDLGVYSHEECHVSQYCQSLVQDIDHAALERTSQSAGLILHWVRYQLGLVSSSVKEFKHAIFSRNAGVVTIGTHQTRRIPRINK